MRAVPRKVQAAVLALAVLGVAIIAIVPAESASSRHCRRHPEARGCISQRKGHVASRHDGRRDRRGSDRSGSNGQDATTTTVAPTTTSAPVVSVAPPASTPAPKPPVTAPAPAPTAPPAPTGGGQSGRSYPWHTAINSTSFWVGELYNASLADGSQVCSTYDSQWAFHWSGVNAGVVPKSAAGCAGSIVGGCDGVPGANGSCATERRTAANGWFPTQVTPRENPFYLDLPFDDLNDKTGFSTRCQVVPWANDPGFAGRCNDGGFSFMKNRWVRMVGPNGNTCYGQIQDAGPSSGSKYHDANYVFGGNDARPAQTQWKNAGADVSPALNGCLGFSELDGQNDRINWQFVDDVDVPAGPWTKVITTSGVNN